MVQCFLGFVLTVSQSAIFTATAGSPSSTGHSDAADMLQIRNFAEYDPFRAYDKKPIFIATTCRDKDGGFKEAEAFVDRVLDLGCYFLKDEDDARYPSQSGCSSEPVVCEDAERLKNVSGLKPHALDAGKHLRENVRNRPVEWTGDERPAGDPPRWDPAFFAAWRFTHCMRARLERVVNMYQPILSHLGHHIMLEYLTPHVHDEIQAVIIHKHDPHHMRGTGERMLVVAQQHAREWISGMATLYVIEEVLARIAREPTWLGGAQLAFVPVANPDGTRYTQTGERFWRRNSPGLRCGAVDINRNWPQFFGAAGSSRNPCSDTFIGMAATSAPEVKALYTFAQNFRPTVALDVHSYGPMLLSSWAGSRQALPGPTLNNIDRLGRRIQDALNNRTRNSSSGDQLYEYGNTVELLYPAPGALIDQLTAWGALAYLVELRPQTATGHPGSLGLQGFDPPPAMIESVGGELLDAVYEFVNHMTGVEPPPRCTHNCERV